MIVRSNANLIFSDRHLAWSTWFLFHFSSTRRYRFSAEMKDENFVSNELLKVKLPLNDQNGNVSTTNLSLIRRAKALNFSLKRDLLMSLFYLTSHNRGRISYISLVLKANKPFFSILKHIFRSMEMYAKVDNSILEVGLRFQVLRHY